MEKRDSGVFERYIFKVDFQFVELLAKQGVENKKILYKEEMAELRTFASEMNMSVEELCEKRITEHCTLYDILLSQRLYRFILYMQRKIFLKEKNRRVIIQSLIPLTTKHKVISLLEVFLKDKTKAVEMYELLKYDKKYKLDIQYTPFIEMGEGCISIVCIFIF